mmetsp:Transcript_8830/g.12833  ORF Transcript_8830/g.12833 Transcript_8830/m.12833 type:complete len:598 (+) Transcript_8830:86-1879(+)
MTTLRSHSFPPRRRQTRYYCFVSVLEGVCLVLTTAFVVLFGGCFADVVSQQNEVTNTIPKWVLVPPHSVEKKLRNDERSSDSNSDDIQRELLLKQRIDITPRIIGGTAASTDYQQHGFIVALYYNVSRFVCGGSLILPNVVLTAAHCAPFVALARTHIYNKYGSQDAEGYEQFHVTEVLIHPNYNDTKKTMDYALLKLDGSSKKGTPITLNNVSSVPSVQDQVTVMGWGKTEEYLSDSPTLETVTLNYVSFEQCRKDYNYKYIRASMICAGVLGGGKDACQGDSGGPLILATDSAYFNEADSSSTDDGPLLLGVVSWGYGCARPGFPGVYQRISSVADWIKNSACEWHNSVEGGTDVCPIQVNNRKPLPEMDTTIHLKTSNAIQEDTDSKKRTHSPVNLKPTHSPTTTRPTPSPVDPTPLPSTAMPTPSPVDPTSSPITARPTPSPVDPTPSPTTARPTLSPVDPTPSPTTARPVATAKPSKPPLQRPSHQPSAAPSQEPTASALPSISPSVTPSSEPSSSVEPSSKPSHKPSLLPSNQPSSKPSHKPSLSPSNQPSSKPSHKPSLLPTLKPSSKPSRQPSTFPELKPSSKPSGDQP